MNDGLTAPTQSIEDLIAEKTVLFPLGIPGFPRHQKYVFSQTSEERPFAWMQSLDDASLAFPVIEAFRLVPDYTFEFDDSELEPLEIRSLQDCLVMAILRIEPHTRVKLYANLRAPLIINLAKNLGRQLILPENCGYSESTFFEF
jgi:flagellar assembly factor FliW